MKTNLSVRYQPNFRFLNEAIQVPWKVAVAHSTLNRCLISDHPFKVDLCQQTKHRFCACMLKLNTSALKEQT